MCVCSASPLQRSAPSSLRTQLLLQEVHRSLQPKVYGDMDYICTKTHSCTKVIFVLSGSCQSIMTNRVYNGGQYFGADELGRQWQDTIRAVGKVEAWCLLEVQLQRVVDLLSQQEKQQSSHWHSASGVFH